MKMARATFPPSRGEPAVASATDNDHKNTSLKQPRTSAAHTYDASDRRRRWRMQRVNTNKQKGHGAEQADVCRCSRWTDGRRRTHLPKHGCQSSHGWLQDIILSVIAFENQHYTSWRVQIYKTWQLTDLLPVTLSIYRVLNTDRNVFTKRWNWKQL